MANTAPVAHGGKLFALKEDGLPHQIDPNTLATIGPYDFNGKWKSQTFTAHPKLDPVSGEMIAFGYEATGLASDDLWIYTHDRKGNITQGSAHQGALRERDPRHGAHRRSTS